MRSVDYENKGREAYRNGRLIFPGPIDSRFWQRRAFIRGYQAERDSWRIANPGADEWAAASERSEAFCKKMIKHA